MTEHPGLPVKGYVPQSDDKVALVNRFKEMEERLLREIENIEIPSYVREDGVQMVSHPDVRWLAIARTGFEQAFMALNRSIFQPQRIRLPEDEGREGE